MHKKVSYAVFLERGKITDLCVFDIFGRLDPFHLISDLVDGIDQRADVARNVV